ncbi:MAG: TlpA family protein disulfide reductase [Flaviaesturariibacter sp.]|nr:TlpA family protein disulfide reductase [Flaviaesturariibacter sp.]
MRFFLLILSCCLVLAAPAQEVRKQGTRTFDETTIVRDSTGFVYPYPVWRALMSRGYVLRAVNPKDSASEMVLVKLNESQRDEMVARMPPPRESTSFRTGEAFGSFKIVDVKGGRINLKEAKGKIVVINFWFVNCQPCRMEMPELNALVDSFKTNDKVIFIAIALDKVEQVLEFLKTNPFNYRIVDNGRYLADRYNVKSYPTHVVIDAEGKVAFHSTGYGPQTAWWLRKVINTQLERLQATASN